MKTYFLLHANVEINEMGLNEVFKLLLLFGFEYHICIVVVVCISFILCEKVIRQLPHVWHDVGFKSKCV